MNREIILKKAVFGGFDEESVIRCIESLQKQAQENKISRDELDKLNSEISELEAVISEQDTEIERLKAELKK